MSLQNNCTILQLPFADHAGNFWLMLLPLPPSLAPPLRLPLRLSADLPQYVKPVALNQKSSNALVRLKLYTQTSEREMRAARPRAALLALIFAGTSFSDKKVGIFRGSLFSRFGCTIISLGN